jgi:hypothetical protein
MKHLQTPLPTLKRLPLIALIAYVPMGLLGLAFLLRVPYEFMTDPTYFYEFAQSRSPDKWSVIPAAIIVALIGAFLIHIAVTGLRMRSVTFIKHFVIPVVLYTLFIAAGVVGLSSRSEASLYDRVAFASAAVCLLCLILGWRTYFKTARATM